MQRENKLDSTSLLLFDDLRHALKASGVIYGLIEVPRHDGENREVYVDVNRALQPVDLNKLSYDFETILEKWFGTCDVSYGRIRVELKGEEIGCLIVSIIVRPGEALPAPLLTTTA